MVASRVQLAAVVWVALLGPSGCADPEPPALPPKIALYPVRHLTGALHEGRLILDGQCLFLETTEGTIYGTAWPANRTLWDAEDFQLIVGDMAAPIGARVELGAELAHLDDTIPDVFVVEPDRECRGDSFLLVEGFVAIDDG